MDIFLCATQPMHFAHISVNVITKNRILKSHLYIGFTIRPMKLERKFTDESVHCPMNLISEFVKEWFVTRFDVVIVNFLEFGF